MIALENGLEKTERIHVSLMVLKDRVLSVI